ncbi:MAG: hypothetical protein ABR584_07170 [Candidatus Baltobacteraceae bacterium]
MKNLSPLLAALSLSALLSTAAAVAEPPMGLPPQPKVHPAGIPNEAVMLSPCVQTMGEHWAALKDMPLGPLYGVYEGKPVFSEVMISVKQLDHGFSYDNLRALPGYQIDHVNVEFEPNGHPGFPEPHYDVHAFYVSPAVEAQICPGGIPDSAMKMKGLKP